MGGHKIFVSEIGGLQFYRCWLFVNLGPPSEENVNSLNCKSEMRVTKEDIIRW